MFWCPVHRTKGCIIIFFFSLYYLQHLTFLIQTEVCLTYTKAEPLFLQVMEKKSGKWDFFASTFPFHLWYHWYDPFIHSLKKNLLHLTSCFSVECGMGQMDRGRERIVWFSSINLVSSKKKEKKQHFNWGFILNILSAWNQGLPQTSRSMISSFCYLLLISSGQLYMKQQSCLKTHLTTQHKATKQNLFWDCDLARN